MTTPISETVLVGRDAAGETVHGFRVAAYRETHPEHGDKFGHRYSEHWSTPNTRDPRVKVERLFTEEQLLAAIAAHSDTIEQLREALAGALHMHDAHCENIGEWLDTEDAALMDTYRATLSRMERNPDV